MKSPLTRSDSDHSYAKVQVMEDQHHAQLMLELDLRGGEDVNVLTLDYDG